MQASSSNFSVEQVELIRRLRNSGITYQQLIDAFQALERIDATFGNTFNTPVCNSLHDARTVGAQSNIVHHSRNKNANSIHSGATSFSSQPIISRASLTTSPTHTLPMTRSAAATETSHMPLTTSGTQRSPFIHMASNVSMPVLSVPSYTDVAKDKSPKIYSTCRSDGSDFCGFSEKEHNSMSHSQIGVPLTVSPTISQAADLTQDQCLILVQCSSQDKVLEFVKKCLMSADFKPVQQAQNLGVSESTMEAFLQGDVFSIEQSDFRKLLSWIISLCHHTEWFTLEMSKLLHFQGFGNGLDFQFCPRRERFTFREKHLDVLEAFWRRKQYPTFEEKEQIAEECNCAMAVEAQRSLDDKEKVTHVNVANWFKNKRKEIKRISKKGETSGETVKTFLDSLNSKSAMSSAVNSLEENKFEDTNLQQQNLQQWQRGKLLHGPLPFDSTMRDPVSNEKYSSSGGDTSVILSPPSSICAGANQQSVVSNNTDNAESYPVLLFQNSGVSSTVVVSSNEDTLGSSTKTDSVTGSSNQLSHQDVVTLSSDSSRTTHINAAAMLPTPYPVNTINSVTEDSTDINSQINFELSHVKQEL